MSENEQSKLDAANKSSEEATRQAVAEILATPMYSTEEVAELVAVVGDPSVYVGALRRNKTLLGVWDGNAFRHPKFQFKNGTLMPEMASLLAEFPLSEKKGTGGWERAFWMYFPNELLEGRCPADVFGSDPQAVIVAAREEFAKDGESDW